MPILWDAESHSRGRRSIDFKEPPSAQQLARGLFIEIITSRSEVYTARSLHLPFGFTSISQSLKRRSMECLRIVLLQKYFFAEETQIIINSLQDKDS